MSAVLDTTDVHVGFWINWSFGAVRGSTVTLTRRDGALLTAFIAMFVAYAGTRIWKIVAFSIYLGLSTDLPQDALFHQRQAILRNAFTADNTLWAFSRVIWAWRKCRRVYYKVGLLAAACLVFSLAFTVAGIFSSQVSSSMGNEVLLSGHNCAWLNGSTFTTAGISSILHPYTSELLQDASQRGQQCYTSDTSASTENCPTFVQSSLPISVTRNASCPFDQRSKICQSNTTNLVLDTGYLDSNQHFGINAPPDERIISRYVVHCAPLTLEDFSSVVEGPIAPNGTALQSEQPWVQYYFGPRLSQPPPNFTYQYPLNAPSIASDVIGGTESDKDYSLSVQVALANNSFPESANFVAIPELTRTDADTMLLFLSSNSLVFSGPVDDAWYPVHQGPFNYSVVANGVQSDFTPVWLADRSTNVLGCTTQMQFCNPNLPLQQRCGPLRSPTLLDIETFASNTPPVSFPWRDETEATRFFNFFNTVDSFSGGGINVIIQSLGSSSLSSRRNLYSAIQGDLPDDQWQRDIEHWFSIQLAALQRAFIETANGPVYPGLDKSNLWLPQNDIDRQFCTNQKILSTDYTSFSTLGLVLTFTIGGVIIVISYLLEPALHWIQRRWRWRNYALTEWWLNETLQLQSFVHEQSGAGQWTREIGVVPTTIEPSEQLATLDLTKPGHPQFKAPKSTTWADSLAEGGSEEKAGAVAIEEKVSAATIEDKAGAVTIEDVGSTSQASSPADGGGDTKLPALADGQNVTADTRTDALRRDHKHYKGDDDVV